MKIISRKLDDKKGKSITEFAYQAAALLSINKKKQTVMLHRSIVGWDGWMKRSKVAISIYFAILTT